MSTTSIALAQRIFATERSLYSFIERMAKNAQFMKDKPNTHKFFASLYNFKSVNGRLTDNQKISIVKEINKNLQYFDSLRTPIVVVSVESVEKSNDTPSLDDDSLASAEYDRLASLDS